MKTRTLSRILAAASIATAVTTSMTASAGSGPKVALDGEAAIGLQPDHVSSGAGAALRVGYQLDATVIALVPEIGGSYHALGGEPGPTMLRAFGGARLAFGAIVRPGIYAHAGWAHVGYDGSSRAAPTYDGGLFLDLTVLPVVGLGLHTGYTMVASNADGAANHFLVAGAHVAVLF